MQAMPTRRSRRRSKTTSGKLKELKRIIDELGDADRVLVVAPLKEMLGDVSHEMRKLGVRLIALDSGNAEKTKRAFQTWEKGDAKGLLSHPEIPGKNLPQATAIIFLSPLVTDTEFDQATGRVVRQGSEAVAQGVKVRVIVLCADDTVETRVVELGASNGVETEIISGLTETDRVVIEIRIPPAAPSFGFGS